MSGFSRERAFGEVIWWRDPERAGCVEYIPLTPVSERAPDGSSTLILWDMGSQGRLQLGAQLAFSQQETNALRTHIGRGADDEPVSSLQPAAVEVSEAALQIDDGTSEWRVLEARQASSIGQHTAVFNVTLGESDKAKVLECLGGRAGRLRVTYQLTYQKKAWVRCTLEGDAEEEIQSLQEPKPIEGDVPKMEGLAAAADEEFEKSFREMVDEGEQSSSEVSFTEFKTVSVSREFGMESDSGAPPEVHFSQSSASLDDAMELVRKAVSEGRWTIERQASPDAAQALRDAADEAVCRKAARFLVEEAAKPGEERGHDVLIDIQALETERMPRALEATADVADWFPDGEGAKHVRPCH